MELDLLVTIFSFFGSIIEIFMGLFIKSNQRITYAKGKPLAYVISGAFVKVSSEYTSQLISRGATFTLDTLMPFTNIHMRNTNSEIV